MSGIALDIREPVIDGGRLRLNSLTGAYSAGNALAAFRMVTLNISLELHRRRGQRKQLVPVFVQHGLKMSLKSKDCLSRTYTSGIWIWTCNGC